MINGYVINRSPRSKYIFKRSVTPGAKIPIKDLYDSYKKKYRGKLDLDFVEWLKENKIPKTGEWEVLVRSVEKENDPTEEILDLEISKKEKSLETSFLNLAAPDKLTATEIAGLKHKDNPRKVIQQVTSVHKLRRALSLCRNTSGKAILMKYIKRRIDQLK